MAQMAFAEHHDMIEAFPADEPINRSAYAFCQGERGDVGRARMPVDWTRGVKISPYAPPRYPIRDRDGGYGQIFIPPRRSGGSPNCPAAPRLPPPKAYSGAVH